MIKVYNTLTKKLEELHPLHQGKINMFVCGPTVYDNPHLGHAKTYTQFDFICNYLRKSGFQVFYLMNITDIDDKIIKRAHEQNITPKELALKYENIFKKNMTALSNTQVSEFARATDHIPQIIKQIKTLIEKGFAYKISDGYYYDLKKFHDYGKLSGRTTLQENDSVSRIDENSEKRNRGDFCLWKFAKPNEPFWETDLGDGRPGWHIEDTAITEHYFGTQYDMHGGAVDLIFPHHEAEIAQQEAASGKKPFVKYWLHTAFLNINSEKMSKSKGNFLTIKDLLEKYDYKIVRFFFLSNHYRMPIDFTPDVLEQSKNGLQRINDFIFNIDKNKDDKEFFGMVEEYKNKIYTAINDDFDTPMANGAIFDFIKEANIKGGAGKHVYDFFKELNGLFDTMTFNESELPAEIQKIAEERAEARKNKNFKKSDELRDLLTSKGYSVDDGKDGQKIRKI